MRKSCALALLIFTGACSTSSHSSSSSSSTSPSSPAPASTPTATAGGGDATPVVGAGPVTPAPVDGGVTPAPAPAPDLAGPRAPGTHTRCGWIATWEGYTQFEAHAAEYHAIHPKWYVLAADGSSTQPAGSPNDAALRAAAKAANVQVIPLIDENRDSTRVRLMINDATNRAQHVANLLALVDQNNYDGIDIDYETLWQSSDLAGFMAFLTALGQGLHARGKELSLAVPGITYDTGGYNYTQLVAVADTLHIMGYDYHQTSTHLGPLAPLGWLQGTFAHAQQTGHPERFIVGLANYAIGSGYYTTTRDALSQCTGAVVPTTDHMLTCPFGNPAAGRAPHCDTAAHGTLWFEDLASMDEKLTSAKAAGLRGVTYWELGSELDGYYDLARKYYP